MGCVLLTASCIRIAFHNKFKNILENYRMSIIFQTCLRQRSCISEYFTFLHNFWRNFVEKFHNTALWHLTILFFRASGYSHWTWWYEKFFMLWLWSMLQKCGQFACPSKNPYGWNLLSTLQKDPVNEVQSPDAHDQCSQNMPKVMLCFEKVSTITIVLIICF